MQNLSKDFPALEEAEKWGRRDEWLFQSYINNFQLWTGQLGTSFPGAVPLVFTGGKLGRAGSQPLDFDWWRSQVVGRGGAHLSDSLWKSPARCQACSRSSSTSSSTSWLPRWPFATAAMMTSCGRCTRCTTSAPTSRGFTASGAVWRGDTSTCWNSATTLESTSLVSLKQFLECVGRDPSFTNAVIRGAGWEGSLGEFCEPLHLESITSSSTCAKYFPTEPSNSPCLWGAATPVQAPVHSSSLSSRCSRL